MPEFALRGLTLRLPESALRGGLEKALTTGRYEHQEADAILHHLRPGDHFLDLGAGLGFLCALAARVVGEAAVTGVEAGAETLALARANLAANGFSGVRLIHGAVTATATGEVEFGQRPAFWASAVKGPGPTGRRMRRWCLRARAAPRVALLAEVRPSVLCCDIEGAEVAVLAQPLPPGLRVIVVEIASRRLWAGRHPGAVRRVVGPGLCLHAGGVARGDGACSSGWTDPAAGAGPCATLALSAPAKRGATNENGGRKAPASVSSCRSGADQASASAEAARPDGRRDVRDHEVARDGRLGAGFGRSTSLMWITSPICLPVRSTVM
jgi:FkbM family methyltransferase